jgi:hypothetical protein
MQLIAQGHIRIVPDVTVSSGENGSSGALTEGLLSLVLQGHIESRNGEPPSTE